MSQRRLHFIAQQKQQTACRVESDETQEHKRDKTCGNLETHNIVILLEESYL